MFYFHILLIYLLFLSLFLFVSFLCEALSSLYSSSLILSIYLSLCLKLTNTRKKNHSWSPPTNLTITISKHIHNHNHNQQWVHNSHISPNDLRVKLMSKSVKQIARNFEEQRKMNQHWTLSKTIHNHNYKADSHTKNL